MHLKKSVAGILLAGGSATRFGGTRNKVYLPIDGRAVLAYSLQALDAHPEIDEIIVVIREGEDESFNSLVRSKIKSTKPLKVVYGGNSRRESVYNGLNATKADYVVIQDGARPFLKDYYITDCLRALEDYPGVAIATRSKDTVKLAYENGLVMRTTNRANTWLVQTPQCFRRDELVDVHVRFGSKEATDDCMMLEAFKKPVLLISGDENNIKITTRSDLFLAEYIRKENQYLSF